VNVTGVCTHGMSNTKIYKKWRSMKRRCNAKNTESKMYKNYSGRGITVCDEWKNDFMAFYTWAMANGYAEGLELDRKDNDKGYSPDNCRFITHKENERHKRTAKYATINGVTKTGTEWAEEYGLSPHVVNERIKHGWEPERILEASQYKIRRITIDGETKSIKEWAAISGLAIDTIQARMDRQWDNSRLLEPLAKPGHRATRITINGETKTVSEWADVSGVAKSTIQGRLARGWTGEDLLKPAEYIANFMKGRN